jgi:DNA modification methylase
VNPVSAPAWRNRIVGSGEEAPDQLLANPANWRTHPGLQRDALRGSLSEVGWVQQIMVNQRTGFVVDGHARVEEALSRHEPTVPVLYVDLSPAEEALVLATLDPIGAMAERDDARLDDLLTQLSVDDLGLQALLDSLGTQEPKHGLTDPDDAPALGEGSNIKRGDLFALGDHRLLCGDCTELADVVALFRGPDELDFGDAQADIVWTDPPYGIDYVGKTAEHLRIDNDFASATRELVASALRLAPLKAGGAFYVASPSGDMESEFRKALEEIGFRLRQQIVWVKDVFVMGRQDYHWRHESVLYGWRDGEAHHWAGGRAQDTVWEIPRPRRSAEHPTMKPVELVARSLSNSSRPGDLVYEPFAGSGSTLIACEQLGRRCAAIEIDPAYAQGILERWQALTGRQAERVDG